MPSSTTLRFHLKIGSLKPDKFRVLEFTLSEAVSECFRLELQAGSDDPDIAYADLIGKDAHLTVEGDDFTVKHHGDLSVRSQPGSTWFRVELPIRARAADAPRP